MPINPSDEPFNSTKPLEKADGIGTPQDGKNVPLVDEKLEQPEPSSGAADAPLTAGDEIVAPGAWPQIVDLAKYLVRSEVHTYAFSVAANTILSLFPFIVLLLTISQRMFHSDRMESVVGEMMHSFLPVGQDFVMRNMVILAHPRKGTQIFSVVMLLVTSTGVFLPLEVALNDVWG